MAQKTFFGGQDEGIELEIVKSWQAFEKQFAGARRLRAITFCDSPELLLDFFEKRELEQLEVVVGDVKDYRERLGEKEIDLVDRLERLKEKEKLVIYTCPQKVVHSKMYWIETEAGQTRLITGSPNLTRTGWSNQTNHIAVIDADRNEYLADKFKKQYREQKEEYGELFLQDLTEELEEEESEREEVIRYWLEGRSSARNEFQELNIRATDKLREAEGEEEIVLSLHGYEPDTREKVREDFTAYGGAVGQDTARISPPNYSRFLKKRYGIPHMAFHADGLHFIPPGESPVVLSQPPKDERGIDRALNNLENYFDSVKKFGETNRPLAVQQHMFEALIYLFWAPFVNLQARLYKSEGITNLDKNLPFLYLYGESNSGKGTFARFALGLLSLNRVTGPLDADELGRRNIRNVRLANSCFPMVVDDIDKSKINQLDPLKNYWSSWDNDSNFPTLTFISNDRKPNEWFRNRAKILHFDVMFQTTKKGESEVNRILNAGNPLYRWVSRDLFQRFQRGDVELHDDPLQPVRTVLQELYQEAGRTLPKYFPIEPAEKLHDMGRVKWARLRRETSITTSRRDGNLRMNFPESFEFWEIDELKRHLPPEVRAEREGHDLLVKNPEKFYRWLGINRFDHSLLDHLKEKLPF